MPSTVNGSQIVDVSYLPTNFGNLASAPAATWRSARRYTEFTAKVPVSKVATTMKASAKPLTLANRTKNSKVTATVKAATGTAKPSGTIKVTEAPS